MDVDKKLGMSLDDLIKKTRKDAPRKARGAAAVKKQGEKTQPKGRLERRDKLGYAD